MKASYLKEFEELLEHSVEIDAAGVRVKDAERLRQNAYKLAETSALGSGVRQAYARYLTRALALELGITPASIHELYSARGRGDLPQTFTVPALNLRVLAFDSARAVFRVALRMNAAAMIFEIARSEMNYTDQRPTEYTTSILAAAIAEGYRGPVFIQGDHFQISAKRYGSDSEGEVGALQALMQEAIAAGFFNIDVDTSTLVDLSQSTIPAQQKLNVELSAKLSSYIRSIEPAGVTISVGGEIGEVGGHNSTEEELRAYLGGFEQKLAELKPGAVGLSKISIQTGTSHGGVVLPDGSIAKVNVDFNTMRVLSDLSQKEYGLGGAVQHGASTLPESAFDKFPESHALEIHLATNFMNIFYDKIPAALRQEIYAYLDANHSSERKPDMTDEQFYYKTRKYGVGQFKKQSWQLPEASKAEVVKAWEEQFDKLFHLLGLKDSRRYVEQTVKPVKVAPDLSFYLGATAGAEEVSDLAD